MLRRMLTAAIALVALAGSAPGMAQAGLPGGPNEPQPLVTFAAGSFPESITVADGHALVSLGFAGQVVRLTGATYQTVASVDVGAASLLTGLVSDGAFIYVAHAPFFGDGPSYLYRLPLDAVGVQPAPWVTLTTDGGFPNGLVLRAGVLYVADSLAGTVRTVSTSTGATAVWCADPLLAPGRYGFGVNGIAFGPGGALYGAVADFGRIVRITTSGGTCHVTTVVESKQLSSADGVAFGPDGLLYVTVNTTNRLVAVDVTTGEISTLAGRSDGLAYPTQAVFADRHTMYLTNGAIANGVPDVLRISLP